MENKMANPTAEQKRIAAATQYQVNEVMTRFYPELIKNAMSIVESEKILIAKHPEHEASIRELCQLKLDTLAANHYMSEVRARREGAKREVSKAVKDWAKSKAYGKYLGSDGLLDSKKVKKDFVKNGANKSWLSEIVEAYNNELVPYAKKLEKEMGAEYTPDEKSRGETLNDMLRKHNAMVMQQRQFIM
jgi:hypothetical protein